MDTQDEPTRAPSPEPLAEPNAHTERAPPELPPLPPLAHPPRVQTVYERAATPRRPPPSLSEASVLVFGANDCAQLGCGREMGDAVSAPVLVDARGVCSVGFGACHSAWLTVDGEVLTVGANDHGQCGLGAQVEELLTPRLLEAFSTKPVAQLSVGASHSAAVTREGELITWGESSHGQCGHGEGTDVDVRKPRVVQALRGQVVVSCVACGGEFTALCTTAAEVFTVGMGRFGALGHGDLADRALPARVLDLLAVPVLAVAAGERHCVALTHNGEAISWGWGVHGQLGLAELAPVALAPTGEAPSARGSGGGKAARQTAERALEAQPTPRVVIALKGTKLRAVACGGAHTLFLAHGADGGHADMDAAPALVLACGKNDAGQLGVGDTAERRTPAPVAMPAGARAAPIGGIAAGSEHSTLWLTDGRVYVWGGGRLGELGLFVNAAEAACALEPRELPVAPISGRTGHVLVCAGARSTAVLVAPGDATGTTSSAPRGVAEPTARFESAVEVEALARGAVGQLSLIHI